MTSINQQVDGDQAHTTQELILGLTLDAEIIQFNINLEQVTGYQRDDVLHKKFDEILLSVDSIPLWNSLLESIRQNMWIDEFVLPLKTKQNQPYMVSWTGFFIKDEHGSFKDICLIGKPLVKEMPEETIPESSTTVTPMPSPEPIEHNEPSDQDIPAEQEKQTLLPAPVLHIHRSEISVRHGRNTILFAKEKKAEGGYSDSWDKEQSVQPTDLKREPDEKRSETDDSSGNSRKETSEDYDAVLRRLDDMDPKGRRHKKSMKKQKRSVQSRADESEEPVETQKHQDEKITAPDEQVTTKEHLSFYSDPFGFRRQREELNHREQQLDVRSKQLDALQSHLRREQHTFNVRVEELSRWREKLELLESAIEKRRQELMKQEDIVLKNSIPSTTPRMTRVKPITPKSLNLDIQNDDETLEKIPHSAAIIQRGILKQMNTSFVEFLGYTMDEIIEKSFFDFISLEGLSNVEKYYLDRLKGDDVSVYTTVFTTKDNHKISAEVSIKQTIYNGEKAEIVIITCLNTHAP